MSEKRLFGLTKDLYQKQLGNGFDFDPESSAGPIRSGETLDPCIRGAEKINADPKLKGLIKEILTGNK